MIAERAAKLLQLEWSLAEEKSVADLHLRRLVAPDDLSALTLQVVDEKNFRLITPTGDVLASGRAGIPFSEGPVNGLIDLQAVTPGATYHYCG